MVKELVSVGPLAFLKVNHFSQAVDVKSVSEFFLINGVW